MQPAKHPTGEVAHPARSAGESRIRHAARRSRASASDGCVPADPGLAGAGSGAEPGLRRECRRGLPARRGRAPRPPAALADASGRDRVLVYVLAYCGLRFGEAAGLWVGDVDLTRRRLRVERSVSDVDGHLIATTPKTHHAREVPVPAVVAAMLPDVVAGRPTGAPLFTGPGGGLLSGQQLPAPLLRPGRCQCRPTGLTPTSCVTPRRASPYRPAPTSRPYSGCSAMPPRR